MSEEGSSPLRLGDVVVGGRHTSMRLEPELWDALRDIARREDMSVNELCTLVARRRGRPLTSSVRVFILRYFREAATEEGHKAAGHGWLKELDDGTP